MTMNMFANKLNFNNVDSVDYYGDIRNRRGNNSIRYDKRDRVEALTRNFDRSIERKKNSTSFWDNLNPWKKSEDKENRPVKRMYPLYYDERDKYRIRRCPVPLCLVPLCLVPLWIWKNLGLWKFFQQKILWKKFCLRTYFELNLFFLIFLFKYEAVIIK